MNKISKKQFFEGAFWKIIETVAAKGVSFIVSLVLARILTPGDYGIIAITTIFTSLSDTLIDGGFSTTLIRKKNVDKLDFSCVFLSSFSIAVVLYVLMFLGAPLIAVYYKEPLLKDVLRVIGLTLFLQAFSSTRNAAVHREMRFKLLFYCNMIASGISGIAGIVAAEVGLGVWALVIQQLSQQAIATILLLVKLHWKFEWKFDIKRFKEIFKFSIGVMGGSLLSYAGSNIYNLVIGKKYSVTDLGYSDKGGQLPMQVSLYTFSAMSSVLLPTLSSYQDERELFKRIMRKVTSMTAFIVFPLMFGMAVTANEIIVLLLTEKWLPSVKIMQYSCLYYMATPFLLINVQIFYALGHGFLRVKTEIIRLSLLISGLLIFAFGLHCTISQLALVNAVIAVIMSWVTFWEVRKITAYEFGEVVKDISKPCLCSFIMAGLVDSLNRTLLKGRVDNTLIRLLICVSIGIVVYTVLSICCRSEGYLEMKKMLESRRRKKYE